MELDKKNTKKIILITSFAVILYWALNHNGSIMQFIGKILGIFSPFLVGFCIAFVLNLLLRKLEFLWALIFRKSKHRISEKFRRPVCLLLSIIILLGIIFAVFFIVVPQLKNTISSFINKMPQYISNLESWWGNISDFFKKYSIVLPNIDFKTDSIYKTIGKYLSQSSGSMINKTLDVTASIASGIATTLISFVFSIYVLAQKETLARQTKKFVRACFKDKKADSILRFTALVNKSFTNFVNGQLTEALIICLLCFTGMMIFRLPYALIVSVLVGFTALIPIFGAFIGTGIGAFLILLDSPIKALWFIVFIIVLQQLEGNLIYPRVVGKSVGLPGIWVLVAVTIGGSAFGFIGMLISVPVCSVVYTLCKEFISKKEDKNRDDKSQEDTVPDKAEKISAPKGK